jgi:hypothetical protein
MLKNNEDLSESLCDELNELNNKLTKLSHFMLSRDFHDLHEDEKDDLRRQRHLMVKYASVLNSRLARL